MRLAGRSDRLRRVRAGGGFGAWLRAGIAARLRGFLGAALRPPLRLLGFDLLERHFHSPVPDLHALPREIWDRPHELPGITVSLPSQMALLEGTLAPWISEFSPPHAPTGDPTRFFLDNAGYESVDAETLYAMVRHLRPSTVVELGSGASTLVIAEALARNAADVGPTAHRVFDPYPRPDWQPVINDLVELETLGANDVSEKIFTSLTEGDILFVDTTHTVKVGSDVNRIVLEVLPRLAPGVIVHFHDVFLPWEYPREWLHRRRFYWSEQYLLQAFLAMNPQYEVLLALHALSRAHSDRLAALIPSFRPGVAPGAFWIRRVT